ncbi:RHOMBOID-like protein 9, chloroplastic isoform X2 [Durio zibethinus]|uniref:RHOMBOID-like protein 9, chloroplastic isoform X2 n=1 Tax=Durio zibethinus TaxID=66656 RepID=A0A6P5Y5N6_DURZI|nr:RHOMBOID-like protein 9, chloroplastic isoform X2 [Durio zibethinus]
MAVVPLCYKMPYKEQNFQIPNVARQSEKGLICGCTDGSKCFSSSCDHRCKGWHPLHISSGIVTNTDTGKKDGGFNRLQWHLWTLTGVHNTKFHLRPLSRKALPKENSLPGTNESQLRLLDSYFGKLQEDAKKASSDSSNKTMDLLDTSGESSIKKELKSLDAYLSKLDEDSNSKNYVLSSDAGGQTPEGNPIATPFSVSEDAKIEEEAKLRSDIGFRLRDVGSGSKRSEALQQYDEASDLYLIILASINIAVFLFEIATPVRSSGLELYSLPSLYGAKINDLILLGEWWRLVTPMFLHFGIFHVALGCWGLLSFGPKVCRHYGSFTFFLIYLLGGISGNLISFLHTPEPTVGGTGPVFAVIGAWLIYQKQNKDVIANDIFERMFQKAMLVTALSCILSNFGPIDDWTHFGAAFTGIAYGFFTCPTLQLDDTSSRTGQEEKITLVGRYADPCKSLIVFTVFIVVFSSLLFIMEPPLNT